MSRLLLALLLLILCNGTALSQDFNQITDDGAYTPAGQDMRNRRDTLNNNNKEIPKGLKVWTVDERFGDRMAAVPDTSSHMFMNTIFTSGMRGEYNTTGNLGAPRINRIFIDRDMTEQFIFTQPYDYFITPVDKFLFTNTLSPITNISYNECGDKTNGEDHLKALFGVNAGKELGMGFKFDYIYGRGYYQNQSTSHFNYSMYASYLGERYNAHLLMSTNHEKVAENGGITDDRYITHPEMFEDDFRENEIPVVLERNWNRNDNQHIFFSHRYNVGFSRKVKMTEDEIKARKFAIEAKKENDAEKEKDKARKKAKRDGKKFDEDDFDNQRTFSGRPDDAIIAGDEPTVVADDKKNRISISGKTVLDSLSIAENKVAEDTSWMKNEYVPVTSFIHTLKVDNYRRIYQAYETPENYYANKYFDGIGRAAGDSIYDKTRHYSIKNTFAIALLEGFNKWAKAGLKAFATSELRHFTIADVNDGLAKYSEHNVSVGGQLSKTQGSLLHYNVTGETWVAGEDAGQVKIDAAADLNFKLFNDTVRLAARAYFYRLNPTFYHRHFHSKHLWWDNTDLDNEIRSHIEGVFSLKRTRTRLRVAIDELKNYTYLAQSYNITDDFGRTGNNVAVNQCGDNISLLTLQLEQDFRLGPLNWENQITYQKSSKAEILPVPDVNVYSNLYLRFKIARVLKVDLGADVRYFTKYYAPDYSPAIGQYTVQDNGENNIKLGGYPIVNVYANMHLKQTRFFVMMSHVNAGEGEAFLTPHYPINTMVFRFGLSWNFFN